MTTKEKNELKLISIIFSSILIIFFICICIWIDIGKEDGDSVTNIFLTGLNVFIMSILTYLLLENSKIANDTNDKISKLTLVDILPNQKERIGKQLLLLDNYKTALFYIRICLIIQIDIIDINNELIRKKNGRSNFNELYVGEVNSDYQLDDALLLTRFRNINIFDFENGLIDIEGLNESERDAFEYVYNEFVSVIDMAEIWETPIAKVKNEFEQLQERLKNDLLAEYYNQVMILNRAINLFYEPTFAFIENVLEENEEKYISELRMSIFYSKLLLKQTVKIERNINEIKNEIIKKEEVINSI